MELAMSETRRDRDLDGDSGRKGTPRGRSTLLAGLVGATMRGASAPLPCPRSIRPGTGLIAGFSTFSALMIQSMNEQDVYDNPLIGRYASPEMARLWSPQAKVSTWRRLWVALAEAQRGLGLAITEEQVAALRAAVDTIDFDAAEQYERRFRHDVMAHVHALGDAAPVARPIIHLGATSCFVTDNADLILIREALQLLRDKTVTAIDALAEFAQAHKALPCLGYTHFQPAQLVTVGKRASLWCYELVLDL